MTRPALKLAPPAKPAIPYSLLRKAARLFKGSYGPRAERHANIAKWIASVQRLGDGWLLSKRHSVQRKENV